MTAPNKTMGLDLAKLGYGDVIAMQARMSGRSWDEIADFVGWSSANISRILNPGDPYWPTLPTLARFCVITRSTLVLDCVRAKARDIGFDAVPDQLDPEALVFAIGGLFREMADVAREGERAVADRHINPDEARRVIRELYDLVNACLDVIGGLRPLREAGRQS